MQGVKSQLIVVDGHMTVRYKDKILRLVTVTLMQQRQLILQQDNARLHIARVCRDFLADNNIILLNCSPYSPDLSPRSRQKGKEASESPTTLARLRNALVAEWNNVPMRTVNALVNFSQRRIRTAATARGGGCTRDIDHRS